ncbi:MAG TPA: FAD-linked oxidase C-terminal domain-containing protein [Vicinamibacterales bacterium]|nr:FAD-linked oxidase C-terminal domain-containing protein [Vicinamibacterales bacterium]
MRRSRSVRVGGAGRHVERRVRRKRSRGRRHRIHGLAVAAAARRWRVRAGGHIAPAGGAALLLVQVETESRPDEALARLDDILQTSRIAGDPVVALPDDERTAARLFELREAVPAAVNARVGDAKARIHPGIQKTAGDFIVPVGSIDRALALYRGAFERRGLEYAIWGHISDGNLHPNLIPGSLEDVEAGRDALREMARGVIDLGGAPIAEHGVGRNPLKQLFLRDLYGDEGIEQMRAVKRALDPDGKFAAGVLFAAARTS